MNADRFNQLCDNLLGMLTDGPRENSRLGKHAVTLLEELILTNWSPAGSAPAVRVNAQVADFAQTAMDGFERWFGPQRLDSEDQDQYRADGEVEADIRTAITSIRRVALEHLPQ